MIVKEGKSRNKLFEGRTSGMGFAFAIKLKNGTLRTVQPVSPCKDYLNEVVFTENTEIPSSAHGFKHPKKLGIFNDTFNLIIKILKDEKYNTYTYSDSIEKDSKFLLDNHKHIETLLNFIEDQVGLEIKTTISIANDGYFLIVGPKEWISSTINISLYTLIIRCALTYTGQDPMKFLENYDYYYEDKDFLKRTLPKLKIILENKRLPSQPKFDIERAKTGAWTPHNVGIMSWNEKYEEQTQTSN